MVGTTAFDYPPPRSPASMATVRVTVHEARGLPASPGADSLHPVLPSSSSSTAGGSPAAPGGGHALVGDPFVQVKFNDESNASRSIKGASSNPKFNFSCAFSVSDTMRLQANPLEIRLLLNDAALTLLTATAHTRDTLLGFVMLDISSLLPTSNRPVFEQWMPITHVSLGMRGEVRLSVKVRFLAARNPCEPIVRSLPGTVSSGGLYSTTLSSLLPAAAVGNALLSTGGGGSGHMNVGGQHSAMVVAPGVGGPIGIGASAGAASSALLSGGAGVGAVGDALIPQAGGGPHLATHGRRAGHHGGLAAGPTTAGGVHLFSVSRLDPKVFHVAAVYSLTEEIVVKTDVDVGQRTTLPFLVSGQSPYALRLLLLFRLGAEVRRHLAQKVSDLGCNAVLGYRETYDVDDVNGVVVRAVGTPCLLYRARPIEDDLMVRALADDRRHRRQTQQYEERARLRHLRASALLDQIALPPADVEGPLGASAASSPPTKGTPPDHGMSASTSGLLIRSPIAQQARAEDAAPCPPSAASAPSMNASVVDRPQAAGADAVALWLSDRPATDLAQRSEPDGMGDAAEDTANPVLSADRMKASASSASADVLADDEAGHDSSSSSGGSSDPSASARAPDAPPPNLEREEEGDEDLPADEEEELIMAHEKAAAGQSGHHTTAGGGGGNDKGDHHGGRHGHHRRGSGSHSSSSGSDHGTVVSGTGATGTGGAGGGASGSTGMGTGLRSSSMLLAGAAGGADGAAAAASAAVALSTALGPMNYESPVALRDVTKLTRSQVVLLTLGALPAGCIERLGGVVAARSVKIVVKHRNRATVSMERDQWWMELREEIRGNAKAMSCNCVIGYREEAYYVDDAIVVLAGMGTAVAVGASWMGLRMTHARRVAELHAALTQGGHSHRCGMVHAVGVAVASVVGVIGHATGEAQVRGGDNTGREHDPMTTGLTQQESSGPAAERKEAPNPKSPLIPPAQLAAPQPPDIDHLLPDDTDDTASPYPADDEDEVGAHGPSETCRCRCCGQRDAVPRFLLLNSPLPNDAPTALSGDGGHAGEGHGGCFGNRPEEYVEVHAVKRLPIVGDSTSTGGGGMSSTAGGSTAATAADELGMALSQAIPFIEYTLHRQLLCRMRVRGFNTAFGLSTSFAFRPGLMVATCTATLANLSPMPVPTAPVLSIDRAILTHGTVIQLQREWTRLVAESPSRGGAPPQAMMSSSAVRGGPRADEEAVMPPSNRKPMLRSHTAAAGPPSVRAPDAPTRDAGGLMGIADRDDGETDAAAGGSQSKHATITYHSRSAAASVNLPRPADHVIVVDDPDEAGSLLGLFDCQWRDALDTGGGEPATSLRAAGATPLSMKAIPAACLSLLSIGEPSVDWDVSGLRIVTSVEVHKRYVIPDIAMSSYPRGGGSMAFDESGVGGSTGGGGDPSAGSFAPVCRSESDYTLAVSHASCDARTTLLYHLFLVQRRHRLTTCAIVGLRRTMAFTEEGGVLMVTFSGNIVTVAAEAAALVHHAARLTAAAVCRAADVCFDALTARREKLRAHRLASGKPDNASSSSSSTSSSSSSSSHSADHSSASSVSATRSTRSRTSSSPYSSSTNSSRSATSSRSSSTCSSTGSSTDSESDRSSRSSKSSGSRSSTATSEASHPGARKLRPGASHTHDGPPPPTVRFSFSLGEGDQGGAAIDTRPPVRAAHKPPHAHHSGHRSRRHRSHRRNRRKKSHHRSSRRGSGRSKRHGGKRSGRGKTRSGPSPRIKPATNKTAPSGGHRRAGRLMFLRRGRLIIKPSVMDNIQQFISAARAEIYGRMIVHPFVSLTRPSHTTTSSLCLASAPPAIVLTSATATASPEPEQQQRQRRVGGDAPAAALSLLEAPEIGSGAAHGLAAADTVRCLPNSAVIARPPPGNPDARTGPPPSRGWLPHPSHHQHSQPSAALPQPPGERSSLVVLPPARHRTAVAPPCEVVFTALPFVPGHDIARYVGFVAHHFLRVLPMPANAARTAAAFGHNAGGAGDTAARAGNGAWWAVGDTGGGGCSDSLATADVFLYKVTSEANSTMSCLVRGMGGTALLDRRVQVHEIQEVEHTAASHTAADIAGRHPHHVSHPEGLLTAPGINALVGTASSAFCFVFFTVSGVVVETVQPDDDPARTNHVAGVPLRHRRHHNDAAPCDAN